MNDLVTLICDAEIVLPNTVLTGDLLIKNGKIASIIPAGRRQIRTASNWQIIEAAGMYLLPGIIDLHSDAIEKEISPRSKTYFPISSSFYELEKKLVASGITTIYHSLSLGGKTNMGIRSDVMVMEIIENINYNNLLRSMIRHLLHLRYEIAHLAGLKIVQKILDQRNIHLLSFMDHTPGQGQFAAKGSYEEYAMRNYNFTAEEAQRMVEQIILRRKQVDNEELKKIAALARRQNITLASHDDDTTAKIDLVDSWGITISEFPININTASYAKSKDLHVAVGAPNIVRGNSHSNNMRASEAVQAGVVDILCSDYYPPSMLAAIFKLIEQDIDLPQAVAMVSLNPARALGIDQQYGSIEEGKSADLILIELYQGHPFVRKTLVDGKMVYQTDYRLQKPQTPQQLQIKREKCAELVC